MFAIHDETLLDESEYAMQDCPAGLTLHASFRRTMLLNNSVKTYLRASIRCHTNWRGRETRAAPEAWNPTKRTERIQHSAPSEHTSCVRARRSFKFGFLLHQQNTQSAEKGENKNIRKLPDRISGGKHIRINPDHGPTRKYRCNPTRHGTFRSSK